MARSPCSLLFLSSFGFGVGSLMPQECDACSIFRCGITTPNSFRSLIFYVHPWDEFGLKFYPEFLQFSHSKNIHRKIAPSSIVAFSVNFLWMSAEWKSSEYFDGLWLMTVVSAAAIGERIWMTNSIDMQTSFHLNLLTQCYWFVVRSLMILSQWELQNRASGLPCETIRSHTESKKENCQIKKFVRYEQM